MWCFQPLMAPLWGGGAGSQRPLADHAGYETKGTAAAWLQVEGSSL